jgi:hypothetical protein
MKKLIAISVVFALVAGTAFAVDLGGAVIGTVDVAGASGGGDPEVFNGGMGRVRLEGSGDAEIGVGTVGGWLRFDGAGGVNAYGLAWWKPIEQLKIQIGGNPDGHYDTSHIGRYGFYAQANEISNLVTADGNWGPVSFDKGVFGGAFGEEHFALIFDSEGLNINVALPLGAAVVDPDDKQIGATFKSALFQVNYSADFGAIHITYAGAGSSTTDIGKIWGSAYLGSLVEGLGLELGVGFGAKKADVPKDPLGIALGASYDAGAFGVKLRGIFEIPMEDGDVAVRVDVLPSYAVNDDVSIFGDLGVLLGDSDNFIWHFAPYVRIGQTWGPGFYAGIRLSNGTPYSTAKTDDVNWSVPIGIIVSF